MNAKINKYKISIPEDISVIYSKKKKMLTVLGLLKRKSMRLKLEICLDNSKKNLVVSPFILSKASNQKRKNIKALRNTTVAKIKHMLIESSTLIYQKLNIKGVGYRAIFTETLNQKVLSLKLGYSHIIYIRTPRDLTVNCITKTKLCIFGNSYSDVSGFSAYIRSEKTPDPYKGKGILFEGESVKLKEGKKI